jgi:hypothetical protein
LAVVLWAVLLCLAALSAVLAGRPPGEWLLPVPGFLGAAGLNLAVVALAFGTIRWLRRSHADNPGAWVCQECNRVKIRDDQTVCKCGGSFLALDEMKWVEGPSLANNPPNRPHIANQASTAIRSER